MRSLCSCGATCKKPPCEKCKPKANSKRSDHYDRQWRVLSERFRAHNPLCQDCEKQGRVEPATEVHHIIPIEQSPSRRLDQSNLVALCSGCSYNEDFQVQPANVINELGPVSYDSQGYSLTINIGMLVARDLANLFVNGNSANPITPNRDDIKDDGKMPEFDMEFVDTADNTVIDSFTGVILNSDSKTIQPNTYVTADLNFSAVKRIGGAVKPIPTA